ncbi:Gfo/Idh/MocA family protein [Salinarimonas soli]|uniref:Gfo/Idh/MocA family oxidoreductase n=1 Tax=Salinarimonas soli TaxID=1638099 RepID=A0A5B2VNI5_9HYPH|nr:Gfo/Idh/MocA family oxidoreductase [Salinarimonas soli]KAA2241223.1 Gfo/Idh/MocA family oxidoreductase [Salinarimonas soli]
MAPVRIGIIAFGIMGERLARAILAHDPDKITLSGVLDPAPAAIERLRRDLPEAPVAASREALIEASDCVYVASPPASHIEHARAALAAGRALFCEKPLAVDGAETEAFVREAEAAGARAAVNFPFASSFAVDQIREWMADGTVGAPRRVTIEIAFAEWPRPWQADAKAWLDRPEQGGFTREVASHFLFLTRRLIGPMELRRRGADFPEAGASERSASADLLVGALPVRFEGRVGGTSAADHNLWTLEGTEGTVRLRDWSFAERHDSDGTWRETLDALPNERARPLVLRRQLDKVAALTEGRPQDLATLREALEVQAIVESILAGDPA